MGVLYITSPFGPRGGGFHNGIDIGLPQGSPIYAGAPGRVVKVWEDDAVNGTAVKLDHGGGWTTAYVHLSRLNVRPGDLVGRSTLLGLSGGEPGTWGAGRSTGPHLHFIVRKDGQPVDPLTVVDWSPDSLQFV